MNCWFGMVLMLAACVNVSRACLGSAQDANVSTELDIILELVQKAADSLDSYECDLVYVYDQTLMGSVTTRWGAVYYRNGVDDSLLRIRFDSKQEDDFDRESYREDYLFDGVWWTYVDYQGRVVTKKQVAEVNEPINALSLATREVPLLGFEGRDKLQSDYVIELAKETTSQKSIACLLLSPKKAEGSTRYRTVEVWVDRGTGLPVQVKAVTPDDEVFTLKFVSPQVNGVLSEKLFELTLPEGCQTPEVTPLSAP